jgi:hypothetical protein
MSESCDDQFKELFRKVDDLLSRSDIAPLLSHDSFDQLAQLRQFARSWETHSALLTATQKALCFAQLADAVSALTEATAELDRMRLKTIPVKDMGHA